ncbi:uncharacterized protein LOC118193605, partial [Stegodyphus dumicola]|uniref:uncharacterized protein LOC118193605 n=1 Tax=Stegodyphus dumicola TaxID=202533 RepID=UPI0015AEB840
MKAVIINVRKISAFVYICSFVNYVISTDLGVDYDEMTEKQVSDCFREITCELGEEPRNKFMECTNYLPPKELQLAFDWFKDYDPPFIFTGDLENKVHMLCDVDSETLENLMDHFLVMYVDHMS